jgi:hypothetical protein
MAFVKTGLRVGDVVHITRKLETFGGYFSKGTKGKITEIEERGYSFVDTEGNRVIEVSDSSYFQKLSPFE